MKADSSAGGKPVGTAWPSTSVNANPTTNLKPCPGTKGRRFQPNNTEEPSFGRLSSKESGHDVHFQHVSMAAGYQDWSPEELRLQDYNMETEKLSG